MSKKKSAEEFIQESKEILLEREINYFNTLLNGEDEDKEELKFLKQLKSRLKFIETLNNELTGKTGKESKHTNEELWAKIIEMQSSVGKIVTSIPKTGSD